MCREREQSGPRQAERSRIRFQCATPPHQPPHCRFSSLGVFSAPAADQISDRACAASHGKSHVGEINQRRYDVAPTLQKHGTAGAGHQPIMTLHRLMVPSASTARGSSTVPVHHAGGSESKTQEADSSPRTSI